jgi:CRISPR-associated protein Cmr1
MADDKFVKIKALTDIWTGDADRKGDRLIATGLLGSIRWWFELIVRGLDGSACDPTYDEDNKLGPCPRGDVKDPMKAGHHCVACGLFGCTGWARKFRLDVLDEQGSVQQKQIKKGQTFQLCFTPLRPNRDEESALLDLTLRLIADYGAIGGRTVFKPSNEHSRANAPHHRDYGLIKIQSSQPVERLSQQHLEQYVRNEQWRRVSHGDFAWASLKNFWYVEGRSLTRQDANNSIFNKVLGRNESKTCQDCGKVHDSPQRCPKTGKHPRRVSEGPTANNHVDHWLAGRQQESKKVFSFNEPPRTFGFVKPGTVDFNEMKRRLRNVWPNFNDQEFLERSQILDRLFNTPGSMP